MEHVKILSGTGSLGLKMGSPVFLFLRGDGGKSLTGAGQEGGKKECKENPENHGSKNGILLRITRQVYAAFKTLLLERWTISSIGIGKVDLLQGFLLTFRKVVLQWLAKGFKYSVQKHFHFKQSGTLWNSVFPLIEANLIPPLS
jgi:hypothetical protein